MDVDFLMRGLNNDLARMDAILAEILAVETGNDFVTFRAEKAEPIALQRKYQMCIRDSFWTILLRFKKKSGHKSGVYPEQEEKSGKRFHIKKEEAP